MKIPASVILLCLFFMSCRENNIEITTQYIINSNWSEQGMSMMIERMKVKNDSIINPFSDLSSDELLRKLQEDSLVRWFANVSIRKGKSSEEKKIYLDKDNGFTWWDDVGKKHSSAFGKLEMRSWYKISGLVGYPYFVYVYIDSIDQVHRFDVNMANY